MKIDINSDLGESYGSYTIGMDDELLGLISSANIACGWHAGDANVMAKTVKRALGNGVAIGCHPGFPDLLGFGRREINVTPMELKNYVKYQIGALKAFVDSEGGRLQHVKPHGAMYNMAAKDEKLAIAIAEAVYEINPEIKLMGLSGSKMISSAEKIGLATISEVFADRAYQSDGNLVPRSQAGAVIHDTEIALNQVMQMVRNQSVISISGETVSIKVDSICVHGDNMQAIEFVTAIRKRLISEGIIIKSFL